MKEMPLQAESRPEVPTNTQKETAERQSANEENKNLNFHITCIIIETIANTANANDETQRPISRIRENPSKRQGSAQPGPACVT
jgi:hypothetical protein